MSDNDITITVDGKELKAKPGQMLIEVTDAAGIDIPRFCYHKKLSVAANCRMCLVEVAKAPKPLPACATPVMPDMIVHTQSPVALAAQKGTMEFLLINHPLDCPICDQGGECELQDVAMGYGSSASQYTEGKRVVMDKYIGPLIATEMTRCIHCTRCVRFGEEIAGIRELGATGRGEDVRIGTYIAKSVNSEVSGNVIDVCPVGALTARPSRYSARAWELTQAPSVAAHDSVGSNIFVHLDGGQINRVVPRENEAINEVWISDRDRFSYSAINSGERVIAPMVRNNGELVETDWDTALTAAADALLAGKKANSLGVLASPSLTLEELYLAQKLGRALGTNNIDHRLGQRDFSADDTAPVMPWLGMNLNDLETLDAALLVGSNIRKDQPIAAVRLRKSALKGGAVSFLNPKAFPLHFDAAEEIVCRADHMTRELLAIAQACEADLSAVTGMPTDIVVADHHRHIAESLKAGANSAVFLGNIAVQHPEWSAFRIIADCICKATGSVLSILPERANTAAAWLAGVLPHRKAGGVALGHSGQTAAQMLASAQSAYLMLGVEAEFDAANPAQALTTLGQAGDVVSISSYLSDSVREHASVVLPMSVFTETFGTWVNAAGIWQRSKGVTTAPGEARPGWKILRVLGEMLGLSEFGYNSPEEITAEVQKQCEDVQLGNSVSGATVDLASYTHESSSDASSSDMAFVRSGETPIYATDPIVRRSPALQKTDDAQSQPFVSMASDDAARLQVEEGDVVHLRQSWGLNGSRQTGESSLPVRINDDVPVGSVWVPTGIPETVTLGALFTPIDVTRHTSS